MNTPLIGIGATVLLLCCDAVLAVGNAANTAIVDASSPGSTVNGHCTSTHSGAYVYDLDFVCLLKRQGILLDSKQYELSIEASTSETTDYVQGPKAYNCLYCVRNESRFDFKTITPPAQFDRQSCEGSGDPPGGGPPRQR